MPRGREGKALLLTDLLQKLVGELHHHARAVAGGGFGPFGTPMGQVVYNGQGFLHNVVAGTAVHIYHKAHATGVPFKLGVIQPLRGRVPGQATLLALLVNFLRLLLLFLLHSSCFSSRQTPTLMPIQFLVKNSLLPICQATETMLTSTFSQFSQYIRGG